MFLDSTNNISFTRKNFLIWFALSFQAGCINAGGFLACHRFVTHTTGFATFFGTEFAQGHFEAALGMLTVPLFFLFGAMASAFFIDRNKTLRKPSRYGLVLILIFISLFAVTSLGYFGFFGVFGEPLSLTRDYLLLSILCLASGMQNAMISSASGAVVRTTHLTGITTDLGIGLVRVFSGSLNRPTLARESQANWLRLGTILSFLFGSTLASFVFIKNQYLGFLIPTLITFLLWLMTLPQKSRVTEPEQLELEV